MGWWLRETSDVEVGRRERVGETVLCICNVENRAISDTGGVDDERRVACLDVAAGRPAGLEADWTSHDAVIVDLNSPVASVHSSW